MLSMSGGEFGIPIVFRGPTGSAGQLGAQHSQNFENWYANCPGLKVVVPSNPADAKGLLKSAIRDNDPVIFMESEQMYGLKGEVPEGEYIIPIGKANVVKEGNDITLVTFGKMMRVVEQALPELENAGISVELIDLRTVRPIDYDTLLNSVRKTNRMVVVEEAWPLASISSEIAYWMQKYAFDYLDAPVTRVTTRDTPLPYAPTLVEAFLPNAKRIVDAVNSVMYRK
jgi:pyruvate dehydrogenase E1 component beta subunit